MRHSIRALLALGLLFGAAACTTPPGEQVAPPPGRERALIAFGARLPQDRPHPIWQAVAALSPRAFVFLGASVEPAPGRRALLPEPGEIERAAAALAAHPDFAHFRQFAAAKGIAIFAPGNGREADGDPPRPSAAREPSPRFLRWSRGASDDPAAPVSFQSHRLSLAGVDAQLILLDIESAGSLLRRREPSACPPAGPAPAEDSAAGLLDEAQWRWLEEELGKSADLRLIASGIQVIPSDPCSATWADFPAERRRLLQLLRRTGAQGVVLLSAGRRGEISRLPAFVIGYPLYEVTASPLDAASGEGASPLHRRAGPVHRDHFGIVAVERVGAEVVLELGLVGADGAVLAAEAVRLEELTYWPRSRAATSRSSSARRLE
ncbi:MAG: hypothetical protein KatS3mg124_1040 [Porticoccaceae bacterium]|nr:MAG: hypothetical protein KatS3mg124_1040 [Porticoccaceae bacterium]